MADPKKIIDLTDPDWTQGVPPYKRPEEGASLLEAAALPATDAPGAGVPYDSPVFLPDATDADVDAARMDLLDAIRQQGLISAPGVAPADMGRYLQTVNQTYQGMPPLKQNALSWWAHQPGQEGDPMAMAVRVLGPARIEYTAPRPPGGMAREQERVGYREKAREIGAALDTLDLQGATRDLGIQVYPEIPPETLKRPESLELLSSLGELPAAAMQEWAGTTAPGSTWSEARQIFEGTDFGAVGDELLAAAGAFLPGAPMEGTTLSTTPPTEAELEEVLRLAGKDPADPKARADYQDMLQQSKTRPTAAPVAEFLRAAKYGTDPARYLTEKTLDVQEALGLLSPEEAREDRATLKAADEAARPELAALRAVAAISPLELNEAARSNAYSDLPENARGTLPVVQQVREQAIREDWQAPVRAARERGAAEAELQSVFNENPMGALAEAMKQGATDEEVTEFLKGLPLALLPENLAQQMVNLDGMRGALLQERVQDLPWRQMPRAVLGVGENQDLPLQRIYPELYRRAREGGAAMDLPGLAPFVAAVQAGRPSSEQFEILARQVPLAAIPEDLRRQLVPAPEVMDQAIREMGEADTLTGKTAKDAASKALAQFMMRAETRGGTQYVTESTIGWLMRVPGGLATEALLEIDAPLVANPILGIPYLGLALAGAAGADTAGEVAAALGELRAPTPAGIEHMLMSSNPALGWTRDQLGVHPDYQPFRAANDGYLTRVLANLATGAPGAAGHVGRISSGAGVEEGGALDSALTTAALAADFLMPWEEMILGPVAGVGSAAYRGARAAGDFRAFGAAGMAEAAAAGAMPSVYLQWKRPLDAAGAPVQDRDLFTAMNTLGRSLAADALRRGENPLKLVTPADRENVEGILRGLGVSPEALAVDLDAGLNAQRARTLDATKDLHQNGPPEVQALRQTPEYQRVSQEIDQLVQTGQLKPEGGALARILLETGAVRWADQNPGRTAPELLGSLSLQARPQDAPQVPPVGAIPQGGEADPITESLFTPTFYSALRETVQKQMGRRPMDPEQVERLVGRVNAKGQWESAFGVKQEEVEDTGLFDWLAEKKAEGQKVTREEVLEFLDDQAVELVTLRLSGNDNIFSPPTRTAFVEPGGVDHAEWLIQWEGALSYPETHWDDPRFVPDHQARKQHAVIAHGRVKTVYIDGKKYLAMEEDQSDWHQKGRKGGYYSKELGKLEKQIDEARQEATEQHVELVAMISDIIMYQKRKKDDPERLASDARNLYRGLETEKDVTRTTWEDVEKQIDDRIAVLERSTAKYEKRNEGEDPEDLDKEGQDWLNAAKASIHTLKHLRETVGMLKDGREFDGKIYRMIPPQSFRTEHNTSGRWGYSPGTDRIILEWENGSIYIETYKIDGGGNRPFYAINRGYSRTQIRLNDDLTFKDSEAIGELILNMPGSNRYKLKLESVGFTDAEMDRILEKAGEAEAAAKRARDIGAEFVELKSKEKSVLMSRDPDADEDPVPNAPLKKAWPEVVFKTLLRHAAQNDFDGIIWTRGEDQARRYDLATYIDSLDWDGETLTAYNERGGQIYQETITSERQLKRIVGDKVALHLLKNVGVGETAKYRTVSAPLPMSASTYFEEVDGRLDHVIANEIIRSFSTIRSAVDDIVDDAARRGIILDPEDVEGLVEYYLELRRNNIRWDIDRIRREDREGDYGPNAERHIEQHEEKIAEIDKLLSTLGQGEFAPPRAFENYGDGNGLAIVDEDGEYVRNDDGEPIVFDYDGDANDWIEGSRSLIQLSGDELKEISTPGAGMVKFYDERLPNLLGKYVKKHGAKVVEDNLPETAALRKDGEPQQVFRIDFTPELRAAALKPQPLYAKKGGKVAGSFEVLPIEDKDRKLGKMEPEKREAQLQALPAIQRKELQKLWQGRMKLWQQMEIPAVGGLPEILTVKVSKKILAAIPKPKQGDILSRSGTLNTLPRQYEKIDQIFKRLPAAEILSVKGRWEEVLYEVTGDERVLLPPTRARLFQKNPEALAEMLRRMTPEQIRGAQEGLATGRRFKDAYISGQVSPEITASFLLWGILSRRLGVYPQEAAFLDIVRRPEFLAAVQKAMSGTFSEADAELWYTFAGNLFPEGGGRPGASAKPNAIDFGDTLLKLGRRLPEDHPYYPGLSGLAAFHAMLSDPAITGRELRRRWLTLADSPGIDIKVVSFLALVTGRQDVLVLDRVQLRNLWGTREIEAKLNTPNLYDGLGIKKSDVFGKEKGQFQEPRPWSSSKGLSDVMSGPRGIFLYEALEDALTPAIQDAYARVGRPQDASLGSFHWETWVVESAQEVGHSTVEALLRSALGEKDPLWGAHVMQGKNNARDYGHFYVALPSGNYRVALTRKGEPYLMTPAAMDSFRRELAKHANNATVTGDRIVPRGFEFGAEDGDELEAGSEKPWTEKPGVNHEALDNLIRSVGTPPAPDEDALLRRALAYRLRRGTGPDPGGEGGGTPQAGVQRGVSSAEAGASPGGREGDEGDGGRGGLSPTSSEAPPVLVSSGDKSYEIWSSGGSFFWSKLSDGRETPRFKSAHEARLAARQMLGLEHENIRALPATPEMQAEIDSGARHPEDRSPSQVGKVRVEMSLQEAEAAIHREPLEHLIAFDPETGQQLSRILGTGDKVEADRATTARMIPAFQRGAIVTHNHPSGYPFSAEDLVLLIAYQLRELRATVPGGGAWVIRLSGWGEDVFPPLRDVEEYMDRFTAIRDEVAWIVNTAVTDAKFRMDRDILKATGLDSMEDVVATYGLDPAAWHFYDAEKWKQFYAEAFHVRLERYFRDYPGFVFFFEGDIDTRYWRDPARLNKVDPADRPLRRTEVSPRPARQPRPPDGSGDGGDLARLAPAGRGQPEGGTGPEEEGALDPAPDLTRDPGPAPGLLAKDMEVRPVDRAEAARFLEEHHYAKGNSNAAVMVLGLYRKGSGELLGVSWWLPPGSPNAARYAASLYSAGNPVKPKEVISLSRLAVHPDLGRNGASYLIGQSLKQIQAQNADRLRRGKPAYRVAVTYADQAWNHTGAIYQATNWTFAGTTRPEPTWTDENGRQMARKSWKNRTYKEMDRLYTRGPNASKYRYVIAIGATATDRRALTYTGEKYTPPRAQPEGRAGETEAPALLRSPAEAIYRDFAGRTVERPDLQFPPGSGARGGWNVLSLFDGISTARQALKNIGLPVASYKAAEIDPGAVQIAKKNHPEIQHLGDVRSVTAEAIGEPVDLLVGGSPCQDLSKANARREGLAGARSGMFFEYARVLQETRPRFFLFENVGGMSEADARVVTETLGVEPIRLDAAKVSGQRRVRYFWTNIPGVKEPADVGVRLQDVLLSPEDVPAGHEASDKTRAYMQRADRHGRARMTRGHQFDAAQDKSPTLVANLRRGAPYDVVIQGEDMRRLTQTEAERLQGLPDGYTQDAGVSRPQALKGIGNAFNVQTVEHIFSHLSTDAGHTEAPAATGPELYSATDDGTIQGSFAQTYPQPRPKPGKKEVIGRLYERNKRAIDKWIRGYLDNDPEMIRDAYEDGSPDPLYFGYWLEEATGASIREDGLIEPYRIDSKVRKILGDEEVVLFHHTSDHFQEDTWKGGLWGGAPVSNPHKGGLRARGGKAVFLTTESGNRVTSGYSWKAAQKNDAKELVYTVRVKMSDLEEDPDDADLPELRGKQFIVWGDIPAEDIVGVIRWGVEYPFEPGTLRSAPGGTVRGTFSRQNIPQGVRYLITLYRDGNLDTLFHELGHLLEVTFPDLATAAGQVFETDQAGRLTLAGKEQLAEAAALYFRHRLAPDGQTRALLERIGARLQEVYARFRGQAATLPPEVRAKLDEIFRPDAWTQRTLQRIGPPVAPRAFPEVRVGATPSERLKAAALAERAKVREENRIDLRPASIQHALEVAEGDTLSAPDLIARAFGYLAAEKARARYSGEELVRITTRTIVPASRVNRIRAQAAERLTLALGAPPQKLAERVEVRGGVEGIALTPAEAAGLRSLATQTGALPMGNLVPARLLDPAAQLDFLTLEELNQLQEAVLDTRAGVNAHRTRAAEAVPASMGLAIWQALTRAAEESSGPDGIVSAMVADLREKFILSSPMQKKVDPAVREIVEAHLREMSGAHEWALSTVRAFRHQHPRRGLEAAYQELRQALVSPVPLPGVAPVLRQAHQLPQVGDLADLLDTKRLRELDGILALGSPREHAALQILHTYAARPGQPLTQTDLDALAEAYSEVAAAVERRRELLRSQAERIKTALAGEAGRVIDLTDETAARIYQRFYEGRWVELLDELAGVGIDTRYDPSSVFLSLLTRLKAEATLTDLADQLARYGFDVRTDATGPDLERAAFMERVRHYLRLEVSGQAAAQRLPGAPAPTSPPAPSNRAGLAAPVPQAQTDAAGRIHDPEAWATARELLTRFGVALDSGEELARLTLPDGSEALLPRSVQQEIRAALDRVAQIGFSPHSATDRTLPDQVGQPLVGRTSQADTLREFLALFPLTATHIKLGITVGPLVPNPAYFVGNAIGAVFQMFQGLGATGLLRSFTEPALTAAIVAEMAGLGAPKVRALVTPDGRVYTVEALAAAAEKYGMNSSFVYAESAKSLAKQIAELHRPFWRQMMGAPAAWQQVLVEANTAVDNFFRISTMIGELKTGKSLDAAAEKARQVGYDYSAVTDFERRWLRNVIMFYSYTRRNTDLLLWTLLHHPSRVMGQLRLMRGLLRENLEEDPQIVWPEWYEARLAVGFREALVNQARVAQVVMIAPPLPVADALVIARDLVDSAATLGADRKAVAGLVTRVVPWLQAPFIQASNVDLFTQKTLDTPEKIPGWYVECDRALTGGLMVDHTLGAARKADGSWYATNGRAWWVTQNLMAGFPGHGRNMDTLTQLDRANIGAVELLVESCRAAAPVLGTSPAYPLSEGDTAGNRPDFYAHEELLGLLGFKPVAVPVWTYQRAADNQQQVDTLTEKTRALAPFQNP